MANQPIPVSRANGMIQDYITYMEGLGVNMSQQTQSVSFDGNILQQWLSDVMPFADELRVFLGASGAGDALRITVILWPYKNGQPAMQPGEGAGSTAINPFNEGQGLP